MRLLLLFGVLSRLVVWVTPFAAAQNIGKWNLQGSVEAGGMISSGNHLPFWLYANRYGVIPQASAAGILQASLVKSYQPLDSVERKRKHFDWGFGITPVWTYGKGTGGRRRLPEGYIQVRYRFLTFFGGRKKEIVGLGDSTLTSGFYAVSGNALPIPKIQLATLGFVPVAFNKFLHVNASYAHGWINTPPYMYGARLHQKQLYFRLGKSYHKAKLYLGINHQVLWAGHSDYLKGQPDLALDGQLPHSWKLYKYVVLGFTPKDWYSKAGYTSFDSYRIGNHLGTYDLALEYQGRNNKWMFYHQHIYEDVSSLAMQNLPDGLYGVGVYLGEAPKSRWFRLNRLLLEFLTTKNQSGATFYKTGSIYQGADNYFNHSQYTEGWSYLGSTIGTPFIAPRSTVDATFPRAGAFFPNNRIQVLYLGGQGQIGRSISFTIRTSFSKNFGTPADVLLIPRKQFSGFVEAKYALPTWKGASLTAQLATDQGRLFGKGIGGYLGVRKNW